MNTYELKLYGTISDSNWNNAAGIVSEIEWQKKAGNEIVVCIHCNGGDVLEGNMIANAIAKAGATIRIDGLAASMAAFMLPYAAKVQMVDNGFIMLHEPSFTTGGTAETLKKVAKQLEDITADFVAKLMVKTGKEEKQVRKWLDGENWYNAREAKEMGLIDEIIPAIAQVEEDWRDNEEIYSRFAAHLIINKNQNQMDKKSIIAKFGLTGVTSESADVEIEAAIEAKITAERMAREKAEADFTAEKTAREAAEASIAAAKDKELDGIVAAAVAEKRITAEKKDTFLTIGRTAGIDALKTAIGAIPAVSNPRIVSQLGGGTATSSPWNERQTEIKNNLKK